MNKSDLEVTVNGALGMCDHRAMRSLCPNCTADLVEAVKEKERERCAKQLEGMAFSIKHICGEPNVSAETKALGKIRIEALEDAVAALRSTKGSHE